MTPKFPINHHRVELHLFMFLFSNVQVKFVALRLEITSMTMRRMLHQMLAPSTLSARVTGSGMSSEETHKWHRMVSQKSLRQYLNWCLQLRLWLAKCVAKDVLYFNTWWHGLLAAALAVAANSDMASESVLFFPPTAKCPVTLKRSIDGSLLYTLVKRSNFWLSVFLKDSIVMTRIQSHTLMTPGTSSLRGHGHFHFAKGTSIGKVCGNF